MDGRLHWIDLVKGFGMFLVVAGHTIKNDSVYNWVYSFHMPLFFLLSGYLMESKKTVIFKDLLVKKTKSLLLPFVFFRVILLVYWLVVEYRFRELDLGPIWFLIVLFFDEVLLGPILIKYKHWCVSILCMVTSVFLFVSIKSLDFSSLSNMSCWWAVQWVPGWTMRILNGAIWFAGGFFIRKIVKNIPPKAVFIYMSLIICSLLSLTLFDFNPNVSMYTNYVGNWVLYIILAFAGIGMTFLFCKYVLRQNKVIEWIGAYSIIILAVHEPIKRVILYLLTIFTDLSKSILQSDVLCAFIVCIIVLIACVPVIHLLKWIKVHTGKFGHLVLSFLK